MSFPLAFKYGRQWQYLPARRGLLKRKFNYRRSEMELPHPLALPELLALLAYNRGHQTWPWPSKTPITKFIKLATHSLNNSSKEQCLSKSTHIFNLQIQSNHKLRICTSIFPLNFCTTWRSSSYKLEVHIYINYISSVVTNLRQLKWHTMS